MASPFYYEDPVRPDDLVDRTAALDTLVDRLADTRNARVEGPRRFGKTSVLRAALARAADEGMVPVYVNFLGVLTVDDVADRIDRAYRTQLTGPLRRWFDGVVRTWRPQASAAPGGVGVTVAPAGGIGDPPALLDRLALPTRLAERGGQRCAIAFDEFQELVRVGPQVPATFRSELEQHRDVAGYVFSGSHPGLMQELFADRRHAFFAQASPVTLGALAPDALADFVTARFAGARRDPGEALGPLLDLARGHPQRAMLIAHHLFEQTPAGATADAETWMRTLHAVFHETTSEVTAAWAALSDLECRVVSTVADETVRLNGAEASRRYGLSRSSSSAVAAQRLWAAGHLVQAATPSGWQVTDPLLRLWIAGGRRWPEEA
jgi:hypothetical protein